MKIEDLPYYVKFVFLCGDIGHSTADINLISLIKNADTRERIYSLNVGDRIIFEPESDKVYQISSISVNHLLEDTKDMLLGIDLEDAEPMQGERKEWLLKILIKMKEA